MSILTELNIQRNFLNQHPNYCENMDDFEL